MNTVKLNILASYIGNGWASLISIVLVPFHIHYLGIEAYGIVGVIALIQSILFICDLGITPTLNREMARFQSGKHSAQSIRDLVRSLEMLYLAIAVAIALIMSVSGSWLSRNWLQVDKLPPAEVEIALSLTGVFVALRWFAGLYRAAISGLQKIVWLNICTSAFATLRGAGVLFVLAFIAPTIRIFLLYQCFASVIEVIVLATITHSQLPVPPKSPSFRWEALSEVWRFAAEMSANMILVLFITQVDKLILSKIVTLSQFGYYTLASTVAGGIFILVGSITTVAFPHFSLLVGQANTAALTDAYHKTSQLVTVISAPIAIIIAIFAPTVLYLWTRNPLLASETAPILAPLIIGNMFNSLTQIPYYLQLAYGWSRLNLMVNFTSLLLIVPLLYFAVPRYGIVAAPVIWAFLNLGWVLITIPVMHRRLLSSEIRKWYKDDVGMPMIAAAASIGTVFLAFRLTKSNQPHTGTFFIFLAATVGYLSTAASTAVGRNQARAIVSFLTKPKKQVNQ